MQIQIVHDNHVYTVYDVSFAFDAPAEEVTLKLKKRMELPTEEELQSGVIYEQELNSGEKVICDMTKDDYRLVVIVANNSSPLAVIIHK